MSVLNIQHYLEPCKTEIFRSEGKIFKRVYSSTLPEGERLKLRFKLNRAYGAIDFRASITDDENGEITYPTCVWTGIENGFDIYEASATFSKIGLYYFHAGFKSSNETKEFFFPDGNVYLPITVYSKNFKTPDNFKGGTMYQIFVDRFAKSEAHTPPVKEYARINNDWENGVPDYAEKPGDALDNSMFFGGNLYGVAEKLDYLRSLGVNILYLCPIFEARTNHKYDTSDYTKVDSMFGGDEALDHLISECKKRKMKIVLDGVFNHVGDDSIYFNKYRSFPSLGAYQSTESPYYQWFDFSEYPDKYNCWWGVTILPAIRKDCADFRKFITDDGGIIDRYLKKGIDGWRLDVADELSDDFLSALRTTAKKQNKNALIIGEVWEDACDKIAYGYRRRYFQGAQLDGVMNYPLRHAIIDYTITGNSENIAKTATSIYLHYPEEVSHVLMNSLGTHDTERILSVLACENIANFSNSELAGYKMSFETREHAVTLLKTASFLQFTLPGIPCIYYGDEAGMEGGRDPFNRLTFPWGREDILITHHYEQLGKLRRKISELANGEFEVIYAQNGLFVYRRGEIICAVNRGNDTALQFTTPVKELMHGRKACRCDGFFEIPLVKNDFIIVKSSL